MIRSVLPLLAACLVLAGAAAPAAGAPRLEAVVESRSSVVIPGGVVRLGDLFEGTGEKADVAVAYAPAPGRRLVFDARWLYRIARAHGLTWQPRSRAARTVVERDSIEVAPAELEDRILGALADRGVPVGGRRVDFAGAAPEVYLPAEPDAELRVEAVAYDPRRERFAVVLLASADGAADRRVRLSGRLEEMTDVPVPLRRIRAGEVIGAADVEMRTVQTRLLPGDVALDIEDLVGTTPRRGLRPGAPVRRTEVRSPIVVARGDLVTLVLATPQMLLTARGRALDEGGRDDVVRVRNLVSNGVIEARVTGPGQVVVGFGPDTLPQ